MVRTKGTVFTSRAARGRRAGVSITLNGGVELARIFEKLGDTIERDAAIQIAASAYEIQNQARAAAPVDTGALRDSIEVRFYEGGQVATVSTKIPRAIPHEFSKKYGNPYLVPAFKTERTELMSRLRNIIRKDIRG